MFGNADLQSLFYCTRSIYVCWSGIFRIWEMHTCVRNLFEKEKTLQKCLKMAVFHFLVHKKLTF